MIRRDRELLTRAAEVNRGLGAVVADLMAHQDDGQLPAERMRALGRAVCWLGADFLARAAELDGRVVDPVPRYLIDPRAGHTTLSHTQWESLVELFGRVCEHGGDDLHDLAAEGIGILECSRPSTRPRLATTGAPPPRGDTTDTTALSNGTGSTGSSTGEDADTASCPPSNAPSDPPPDPPSDPTCNPLPDPRPCVMPGRAADPVPDPELRARAHRVIGLLAKLADSPNRDQRAVHDTGKVVHELALWLLAYPGEPEDH